ncbi:hypothetical protein COS81_01270 [candidate division WWE3 bacterium CG06_land_8_20_14_3_00_42_16]|uniref:Transposase IS200-like domain-containing protein n=3 Tax=Katanobacteria TaxID=422282 RepID=A0A2M7AP27_UNCKA|nr:MAG: hypothetical protein AUJ38_01990 [bacterium CG1_02_42_9]PIU69126.1 MAG: hypothetical protein COS81_01270 [candidate division WWE3 bacterium CG06_land_8_20_14_3_00_42_16]PJA37103.1 MAG: hypothetical protein CO181_04905 [candidate division WWE3 bacterium CG_4_9_14_3_um_filter_43_9]PJC68834.1 MAG: hypothetical protein CO015_02550 [candidate division WWE3 bacterium CG_4_8_14_3_um_filter_42_11]
MPKRKHSFCTGYYYHIYNRGNNKQAIFYEQADYYRFYQTLFYYRFRNLPTKLSDFIRLNSKIKNALVGSNFHCYDQKTSLICYALMPNHFHLLVTQHFQNGISDYLREATDSYTRFFNTKHRRDGSLFQGRFKSVLLESDEQLLHLSRYIHLNPVTSGVLAYEKLEEYPWTSMQEYSNLTVGICKKDLILSRFSGVAEYKNFVLSRAAYQKTLVSLKKLTLE